MNADLKKKFGRRIKELRRQKGYTQEQVAEIVGIEPPNISKLEKGVHFPLAENIEKLARALEVEVKEMFDFEHFSNKNELTKKIHKYVDCASEREIEFLYKFIRDLEIYKNN